MASNLSALSEQLSLFSDGAASREELRRWFTPFHVANAPEWPDDEEPPWDPEADSGVLFGNLVYLFEDDSYSESGHRTLAVKVVQLLRCISSASTALDILPLIRREAKLCEVIRKHRAGTISRNGLLSVVSKNFQFDAVRDWLAVASPGSLDELCAKLAADDYLGIEYLLSQSPG